MRKTALLSIIFLWMVLSVFSQETQTQNQVIINLKDLEAKIQAAIDKLSENKPIKDDLIVIKNDLINLESNANIYISGYADLKCQASMVELNGKIDKLNKSVSDKDNEIKELKDRLLAARGNDIQALIKLAQESIDKSITQQMEYEKIKDEKEKIEKQLADINTKIGEVNKENGKFSEEIKSSNAKIIELNKTIDEYSKAVKFGLSIGINGFLNNQLTYTVQADQTVREKGHREGICGMVSAVVAIKVGTLDYVAINVPLGDFTSDSNKAVGLFNNRMAVGLGYCRQFSQKTPISFIAIVNLSPYDSIDYKEIELKKFNMPEFTKLKPEDYGSVQAWSPSITIGVGYFF